MRLLFLVLFALAALIQYPLWLGKGGWFKVWDMQSQVVAQRETNEGLRARNAALAAEVVDLRTGTGALEERARGELGMMKEGEVFVQILPLNTPPPAGVPNEGQDIAGARPGATPVRPATPTPPIPSKPGAPSTSHGPVRAGVATSPHAPGAGAAKPATGVAKPAPGAAKPAATPSRVAPRAAPASPVATPIPAGPSASGARPLEAR